jgi:hypothetical protein
MFNCYLNEHDKIQLERFLLSLEPFATKPEAGSDPCSSNYLVPLPRNSINNMGGGGTAIDSSAVICR